MMDRYLLEAMREVDALLPGTPPIAPGEWIELDCHPSKIREELERRGLSVNSGLAAMMQNAAFDHDSYLAAQNIANKPERQAALAALLRGSR